MKKTKMINSIFIRFFQTSLIISVVIILSLIAFKVFDEKIDLKIRNLLSLLMIIFLIIPAFPEISMKIKNILVSEYAEMKNKFEDNQIENLEISKGAYDTENISNNKFDNYTHVESSSNRNKSNLINRNISIGIKVVSYIWLSVMCLSLILFIVSLLRFKLKVRSARNLRDVEIKSIFKTIKRRLNLKIRISLLVSNEVKSPCVCGIFKTKIYIPEEIYNKRDIEQLTHILFHELVHCKRKDLYINMLSILAVSIHWFNPLVYKMIRKYKEYRECAVDACVLEYLGEDKGYNYGMTLINLSKMLALRERQTELILCFETKNMLRGRIEMINRFKKGAYKMSMRGALACLVTAVSVVTCNAYAAIPAFAVNESNAEILTTGNINELNSLKEAQKIVGYDFKVPKYIEEECDFSEIKLVNMEGTEKVPYIFYDNLSGDDDSEEKPYKCYTISISKYDPVTTIRKISDAHFMIEEQNSVDFNEENKTIGNINGKLITMTRTIFKHTDSFSGEEIPETKITERYFSFKDGDLNYNIGITEGDSGLSSNSIEKIASSLTAVDQAGYDKIKTTLEQGSTVLNVNTENDLNEAKKLLGFAPKDLFNINNMDVEKSSVKISKIVAGKPLYKLNTIYSGSIWVIYTQSLSNEKIDSIIKNGYYLSENINGTKEKIQPEKINIDNVDVYKDKSDNRIYYEWKDNGVYNELVVEDNSQNEDIVKKFIEAKTI
ncbi:MAG: M56 family metallopeptidase [Clostridium sp.]